MKRKIFLAIPTMGTICDAQGYVLREIVERYGDQVELVYPKKCVNRIFHDFARNAMIDEFLETDCEAIWFLDSDIAPQKHVLELVTLHWDKWLVAGAPYPVWMTPPDKNVRQIVYCVYKGTDGKGLHPTKIPYEGTDFVDGLATGCLFIKREVFSKLEKPYFEFKHDPQTRQPIVGEDIDFCLKMGQLGIKFFTDFSMVCKHYKNVCLLEMNNYAIERQNEAVLAYDAQIRPQIAALAAKLKQQAQPKSPLIFPRA